MQIEETIKLKISCLELATKTHFGEGSVLLTAKEYFDWVNQENSDLDEKINFRQVQEKQ
ncbi:hypothetical protein SAMN02745938_102242 [Flavobacterium psychrophilum DSM 3660]|uniref:hypothetical protein n=1 Tax=Flavobacterium psychrophilum TaxID=96345 RepID=UPI0008773C0A|nr:hypothetical protein [Flavobacterium psychrophilum]MBF2044763.1 hypothetical protein [Flavobacterium psychrophilum]SCX84300.1 hypothetical protein SAMN02745938_102242 [Flavobacterium psychrophilum DSM 3660] [Flavobacterium psychrophilum DSM 3660 = ATCC 49418]SNB33662.1 hypothetical protein NO042_250001 [Flavobacterium psychrophilum]